MQTKRDEVDEWQEITPLNKGRWTDILIVENILKKPYLDEYEVSRLTGISVFTLRNDRHLGQGIAYLKVRKRKIMYRTIDALEYMEKNRVSF